MCTLNPIFNHQHTFGCFSVNPTRYTFNKRRATLKNKSQHSKRNTQYTVVQGAHIIVPSALRLGVILSASASPSRFSNCAFVCTKSVIRPSDENLCTRTYTERARLYLYLCIEEKRDFSIPAKYAVHRSEHTNLIICAEDIWRHVHDCIFF